MTQQNLLRLPLLLLLLLEAANAGGRQFILIFDAGSTGTRLGVFEFALDCDRATGLRLVSLKEKKSSNGLSAFANAPERLREDLAPLMEFAKASVLAQFHADTRAIMRATAGLRVLSDEQRRGIVRVVAQVLRRSNFNVPEEDSQAVGILSGKEEAEFGWVAVNYLMDAFEKPGGNTFGMLDLGGGSTQIAFEPVVDNPSDENRVVFRTARGQSYPLYVRSYLNLGMSQALLHMIRDYYDQKSQKPSVYLSKCLSPKYSGELKFGLVSIQVAGNPEQGAEGRSSWCAGMALMPLVRHRVYPVPAFKASQFVAVSSFFYTAKLLRKLNFWRQVVPGEASLASLKQAANKACLKPPHEGKHEPFLCMYARYAVILLETGYNLPFSQRLLFTNAIKGFSTSWPVGLAIDQLKPKVMRECKL